MNRTAKLARQVVVEFIHIYQAVRLGKPSPCRFVPSCSAYAAEAVETHGVGRGVILAMRRLGRCRPAGGRGFDPVPS